MPNMLTTEYARAAAEAMRRAAEERARRERERRRAAVQRKIDDWSGKLSDVTSQISALGTEKGNLETYMEEWEAQKSKYNGNNILSEVVIVNTFEGVCADNIKDDFTEAVTAMDWTYNGVNVMRGDIDTQIARLNEYKATINSKLTSLRNELNSI